MRRTDLTVISEGDSTLILAIAAYEKSVKSLAEHEPRCRVLQSFEDEYAPRLAAPR